MKLKIGPKSWEAHFIKAMEPRTHLDFKNQIEGNPILLETLFFFFFFFTNIALL